MSEPISFKQELLRKTVHLSSLWMPLLMGLTPSRVGAGIFFAVLCLLNLLVEYGYYRNWRGVSWLYGKLFGKMMRNQDRTRFHISGSPPVLASACLTVLLFPRACAVCAFTTMLLADTAAALIGRRFGKIRFYNGKSLEGSLAFVLVGILVLAAAFFCGAIHWTVLLYGCAGVVLACLAEFFNTSLHIDDNFSIPLIIGGMMSLSFLF